MYDKVIAKFSLFKYIICVGSRKSKDEESELRHGLNTSYVSVQVYVGRVINSVSTPNFS